MDQEEWKTSGPCVHCDQTSGSGRTQDGGGGRELVLVKLDSLLNMTNPNGGTRDF